MNKNTNANNKKNQHYVWRKHIAAWSEKDKIWCIREGDAEPFQSNPRNVAAERYFYELQVLSSEDLKLVKSIAFDPIKSGVLAKFSHDWVEKYQILFELIDYVRKQHTASAELNLEVVQLLKTLDEDFHSYLESTSGSYLDQLRCGDVSFYKDDGSAVEFCHFLSYQYLRTKKIQEKLIAENNEPFGPDTVRRIWPLLRHVFSINIGAQLFLRRDKMPLILVDAPPNIDFITCDQPVMNTYGAYIASGTQVENVEMYYPLSPRKALLLSDRIEFAKLHGKELSPFLAMYLNQIVERSSYHWLFAQKKESLRIGEKWMTPGGDFEIEGVS